MRGRWLLFAVAAIVLAIAAGVAATLVGALTHDETRHIDGDFEYHLYGWPWDWWTDAPPDLIRLQRDNAINYRYRDNGFAPYVFLFTTAVWTLAALFAESIVAVIGWRVWWFARQRRT